MRLSRRALAVVLAGLTVFSVQALFAAPTFDLPAGAARTGHQVAATGLHSLPSHRFVYGDVAFKTFEGARATTAWSVPLGQGESAYQLFQTMATQLDAQGFQTLLRCGARECGGFDFRQAIDVLPPPAMFLDLSEFYVLTAVKSLEVGEEGIMVLVSRTGRNITCQVTHIAPITPAPSLSQPEPSSASRESETPLDLVEVADPSSIDTDPLDQALINALETMGMAVLEDVAFASGSGELGTVPDSLTILAQYLTANPSRKAIIVGHSDISGDPTTNMALSKSRAQAVRTVLVERLGVPSAQVSADGVGHLAPRDTNASSEGMARNRRVEVVLQDTQPR